MAALEFNERHQGESESFESFATDLNIFVKDCDYQEEERMVRDAIFFRRKSTKVRESISIWLKNWRLKKRLKLVETTKWI